MHARSSLRAARGSRSIERLEPRWLLAADLLGTSFDFTPDLITGAASGSVSFTVRNQGSNPIFDFAGPFTVRIYLSSNSTINPADIHIGSHRVFAGLQGGETVSPTVPVNLPASDPFHDDNQYFIGMIIDADNEVLEASESNNSNRGQNLDKDDVASEADLPSPVNGMNVMARSLTVGKTENGSFSDEWIGPRDQDIYEFGANANTTISFDFDKSAAPGSQDAYLRVFNSSWNLLAANDDAPAPGETPSKEPYLAHTFTTTGIHYLVVSGAVDQNTNPRLISGRVANQSGTYSIHTAIIPNAPAVPNMNSSSDTGQSSSDNITNDTTPTFTITGEPGGRAMLYSDGVLVGSDPTSSGAGTYVITASALSHGMRAITATIINSSGFEGLVSPPLNIEIDTLLPSANFSLTASSDSGRSDTDGITTDTTPSFSGNTLELASVTYFKDGVALGTTNTSGAWGFNISTPLADGDYDFTATVVDVAGNVRNSSAPLVVTIDTTAPPQPAAPDMDASSDSGRSNTDNITNAPIVTFRGTVEPFAGVRRFLDGVPGSSLNVSTSTGGYSVLFNGSDGTYTIAVQAEDAAGNVSPVSPGLEFTYDTVAPGSAYQPDLHPDSDLGFSNTDDITADNTPVVIGRHDLPDTTVEILVDGVVVASGIANASTVNIQLPLLSDGVHQIRARARDAAGNTTGVQTTILTVTIETVAPQITNSPVFDFLKVQEIVYKFSEDVGASLALADFAVQNITTSTNLTNSEKQLAYVAASRTATLSFSPILQNGVYTSTLAAADVTDLAGNPLPAGSVVDFFFVNGDANHDGRTNALDFNAVASNFGLTGRNFSDGNFNYDSSLDSLDFNILALHFNATLPGSPFPAEAPQALALPARAPLTVFSTARIDDVAGSDDLLVEAILNSPK